MNKEDRFNLRLNAVNRTLLDRLAAHLGQTRASVVSQALRALAKQEGIPIPEPQPSPHTNEEEHT